MSARDDLMTAARDCLVELGFGATTVRDVAARAGVNHAAIGYHYGSREALLTEALVRSVDALATEVGAAHGTDAEKWSALLSTFETHRALWAAQLEAVAHASRSAVVREHLAAGQQQAREGLGGSLPLALLVGLAVQSLVDGQPGASATDVAALVRGQT